MPSKQPQPSSSDGPDGDTSRQTSAARPESAATAVGCLPVDIVGLIGAHHASLFRYAYRLTGMSADAEDLTQQAFLIAQQKLHQLRHADRAAGWLFAILRSCYLKWRRKKIPLTSTQADLDMGEVAESPSELETVDAEELQQVLGDLAEELRLILLMFYFEELSYKQIADELEVPIGTVMSRLSRAKQKLRERLGARKDRASPAGRKVTLMSGRV